MGAEVLPYHWDDRARVHADYLWLQEFHERLLRELAADLNQIHGVDHGLRYWRILVGPWLGYFVQMLFDRWACIQRAIAEYELSGTVVLFGGEDALITNDMSDFSLLYVGDEWNHHICGAILQRFSQVPIVRLPRKSVAGAAVPAARKGTKKTLARWYSRIASTLARESDTFFLSTYLPPLDELRLQLRLGQVPQRWYSVPAIRVSVDESKRRLVVRGESHSPFEVCARTLIPTQMPAVYIEGYRRLVEQCASLPWPKHPKVIWTSNAHNSDDVFKAWAAEKTERGTPLLIGQHGGHYGIGRWSFNEDHDIAISDRYLTWGWSNRLRHVKPVGQFKARRPLEVRHSVQARALMVTFAVPRFSYWMYSAVVSRQWLDYFSDQCKFVASLPRSIQSALIVRLYPEDYGWDQLSRWRNCFPDLQVDNGESCIDDLIRQSRLYISTYNATTFLESITMNVPTVMYWNPSHWELRVCAEPHFANLKRVGIFHENPQSAAQHVAAIWENIDSWWQSVTVQEVLEQFKQRYCHLPDDLLDCVEQAIGEVTIASSTPAVK
jgi:putative transferase (TIGR04331 family)